MRGSGAGAGEDDWQGGVGGTRGSQVTVVRWREAGGWRRCARSGERRKFIGTVSYKHRPGRCPDLLRALDDLPVPPTRSRSLRSLSSFVGVFVLCIFCLSAVASPSLFSGFPSLSS